jgi:putative transposase
MCSENQHFLNNYVNAVIDNTKIILFLHIFLCVYQCLIFMDKLPFRKPNRLKYYDYANNGYYFVTICTKNRFPAFGEVVDKKMIYNRVAHIVENCWLDLPRHYKNCQLDEFVIMPDHFHGIIMIGDDCFENTQGNGYKPFPTHNLSEIIRGFKTFSSKRINKEEIPFQWQKSFYDHIIRNDKSLCNIRQYIYENPMRWQPVGNGL